MKKGLYIHTKAEIHAVRHIPFVLWSGSLSTPKNNFWSHPILRSTPTSAPVFPVTSPFLSIYTHSCVYLMYFLHFSISWVGAHGRKGLILGSCVCMWVTDLGLERLSKSRGPRPSVPFLRKASHETEWSIFPSASTLRSRLKEGHATVIELHITSKLSILLMTTTHAL